MKKKNNYCRYLRDDGSQCVNSQVQGSQFCELHGQYLIADLEVYKAITEHYRQDIREFWSRSNFYLLVQAGLLSVFVTQSPQSSGYGRAVTLALGFLGLTIAIAWFLVSRGSVVWIRRWREHTMEIDKIVDRHRLYTKAETFASSNPLLSSSNITQFLPLFFCVGWIVLIVFLLFFF
jgi:hypothetical protein